MRDCQRTFGRVGPSKLDGVGGGLGCGCIVNTTEGVVIYQVWVVCLLGGESGRAKADLVYHGNSVER